MAKDNASKENSISISVIRRMPRYYRFLGELEKTGCTRISSRELSEKMGLTASQIRQDLNCFGGFGQQGYGYNVPLLRDEIGKILGLDKKLKAILIGVGNLGRAIVTHMDFEARGFNLIGLFDNAPEIIGTTVNSHIVENIDDMEKFCKKHKPSVAILCIPKHAAKELSEQLVEMGIKGFWNFSHYDLKLNYDGIVVENVHLGDSLMTLSYMVNKVIE
ncbi:MAG: redox-sensing transcriptional repressor Rex [Clostridiales bacterium]|nr:redox-sensing transcriptional repressor Rex [Clostridiales bacterium]